MFKHSHPAYDILSLHVQTQPSCIRHSVFTCSNTAILHATFCLYMFKHSHPAYDILSLHVQTQPSCIRHSVFTCSNTDILHTTFSFYMFKHSHPVCDILSLHVQTQLRHPAYEIYILYVHITSLNFSLWEQHYATSLKLYVRLLKSLCSCLSINTNCIKRTLVYT